MYYKINKEQANQIGIFQNEKGLFSPWLFPQKDGSFLVDEDYYEKFKNSIQLKNIDFKKIEKTDINDCKEQDIEKMFPHVKESGRCIFDGKLNEWIKL